MPGVALFTSGTYKTLLIHYCHRTSRFAVRVVIVLVSYVELAVRVASSSCALGTREIVAQREQLEVADSELRPPFVLQSTVSDHIKTGLPPAQAGFKELCMKAHGTRPGELALGHRAASYCPSSLVH